VHEKCLRSLLISCVQVGKKNMVATIPIDLLHVLLKVASYSSKAITAIDVEGNSKFFLEYALSIETFLLCEITV